MGKYVNSLKMKESDKEREKDEISKGIYFVISTF